MEADRWAPARLVRANLISVYKTVYNALAMMTLSIDRGGEAPVYEQVADQLRRMIASGDLPPGAPLPAVRQLAGDLGVNLNTIARAYRLLEGEGFLAIRQRAGVTVAAPASRPEPSAQAPLLEQLRVAFLNGAAIGSRGGQSFIGGECLFAEAGGCQGFGLYGLYRLLVGG